MMADQVIGLDIGRRWVKAYNGHHRFKFSAYVGEGRDRNLRTDYGEDAFDVVHNGERQFIGKLAFNESEYCRTMMTDDKAHADTLLLALTALYKMGASQCTVVTGLPVKNHNDANKQAMRNLLLGKHTIQQVNGSVRDIYINRVEVAVEGGGAFYSAPRDGLVRLLDGGSKTFNAITMRDRLYNDRGSWTLLDPDGNSYGFETNRQLDEAQLIKRVAGELSKRWGADDAVYTTGGNAEKLAELLRPYFPNTSANSSHPIFDNAIGYYNAGKALGS